MIDASTSPIAGWYPDPIFTGHQRWWDGTAWTERSRSAPGPTLSPRPRAPEILDVPTPEPAADAPEPAPMRPAARPTQDPRIRRNGSALSSLLCGVLAWIFLVAATTAWIPVFEAVAAIGFGVLAMRRRRATGTGRKRAITGIVLGTVALPIAIAFTDSGIANEFWAGYTSGRVIASVEDDIRAGVTERADVTVDSVRCPSPARIERGLAFTCVVTTVDGAYTLIDVRIVDDSGAYDWSPASSS